MISGNVTMTEAAMILPQGNSKSVPAINEIATGTVRAFSLKTVKVQREQETRSMPR